MHTNFMGFYLFPAIWGIVLLFSFVGYGSFLKRVLFGEYEIGWADEAAWGMAFLLFLGGVLNLFYAVSYVIILVVVLTGLLSLYLNKIRNRLLPKVAILNIKGRLSFSYKYILKFIAYSTLIILAGIRYLNYVNNISISRGGEDDDISLYYPLVKQMIDLGGLNADPFDGLRLGCGFGGQSFLEILLMPVSDFNNLYLMDGGVALIICLGLLYRICTMKQLAIHWTWAVLVLFLFLPFPFFFENISSLLTGAIFFLAIYSCLSNSTQLNDAKPIQNAFIIGLMSAGAFALKTSLIPPLFFILAFSYTYYVITTGFKRFAILEALLIPVFIFLFLAPWMLSLYHTSGTMLYPVFGYGFDEASYGKYVPDEHLNISLLDKFNLVYRVYLKTGNFLLLFGIGAAVLSIVKITGRGITQAYILGSYIGCCALLLKYDPAVYAYARYVYVPIAVALFIAIIEVTKKIECYPLIKIGSQDHPTSLTLKIVAANVVITAIFFMVYMWLCDAVPMYSYMVKRIPALMQNPIPLIPNLEIRRHELAQNSVPIGEAIISRDKWTMLYNYKKNKIYHLSSPGTSSLPDGLPYFEGSEAVAAYFLKNGIKYVAYAYKSQAGYPVEQNLGRHYPKRPYFHRISDRATVALDHVLGELGAARNHIYDDGELYIIDLTSKKAIKDQYSEPNYFQIGKILVLAWAETRGFDSNKIWTNGHGEISGIEYKLEPGDAFLALNTFGNHPWKDDLRKLNLTLSVNGEWLPFVRQIGNSYFFSLAPAHEPIKNIVINSSTFLPSNEHIFNPGNHATESVLGIDVDTIQIIKWTPFLKKQAMTQQE